MKKKLYFIALLLFSCSVFSQNNTQDYWQDAQKPTSLKQQNSAPPDARVLRLNESTLRERLSVLREAPRGQKMLLTIPFPNAASET